MGFDPEGETSEALLRKILDTLTDLLLEIQGLRDQVKRLPHDFEHKNK